MDRYQFNDGNEDDGWDAVWDVAVSKTPRGWRAEFRIPFSQLRFRRDEKPTFGSRSSGRSAGLNETSTWPLMSKSANGFVSSFGELRGLAMTASLKRLELMPYTRRARSARSRPTRQPAGQARPTRTWRSAWT